MKRPAQPEAIENHCFLRVLGVFAVKSNLSGIGTIPWTAVEKIAGTNDPGFIYLSKAMAFVIPKYAFRDEWGFKHFVETVQSYHEAARRSAG